MMGPPDFSSDSDSGTNRETIVQENRRRRKQQGRLNKEIEQIGWLAKDLAEMHGGEIGLRELYLELKRVRLTLSLKYLPAMWDAELSKSPEQFGQAIIAQGGMQSAVGGAQSAQGDMQSAQGGMQSSQGGMLSGRNHNS